MAETDFITLFSDIRNGDGLAFERIYHELKQPVFTICWRILQSKELAEDITHDVFVKLYTSPPDPSVRNPRAWVFQMAHNLAIDALRRGQYAGREKFEPSDADEFSCIQLRIDLDAAIGRLPCLEREILTMHLNADLKFHEISGIVGMSLPAVYRRYRKALKTLQDDLNGGAL